MPKGSQYDNKKVVNFNLEYPRDKWKVFVEKKPNKTTINEFLGFIIDRVVSGEIK